MVPCLKNEQSTLPVRSETLVSECSSHMCLEGCLESIAVQVKEPQSQQRLSLTGGPEGMACFGLYLFQKALPYVHTAFVADYL